MPEYSYIDDSSGRTYNVMQSMNEPHELEVDGKKLRRIFHVPLAAVDTKVNPYDQGSFLDKTSKMRGTIGDMQDFSRELSDRRGGDQDPIKQKYYDNYSTKRKGKLHPDVQKKNRKERLDKLSKKTGLNITD